MRPNERDCPSLSITRGDLSSDSGSGRRGRRGQTWSVGRDKGSNKRTVNRHAQVEVRLNLGLDYLRVAWVGDVACWIAGQTTLS